MKFRNFLNNWPTNNFPDSVKQRCVFEVKNYIYVYDKAKEQTGIKRIKSSTVYFLKFRGTLKRLTFQNLRSKSKDVIAGYILYYRYKRR
jgi:hypothetical protein